MVKMVALSYSWIIPLLFLVIVTFVDHDGTFSDPTLVVQSFSFQSLSSRTQRQKQQQITRSTPHDNMNKYNRHESGFCSDGFLHFCGKHSALYATLQSNADDMPDNNSNHRNRRDFLVSLTTLLSTLGSHSAPASARGLVQFPCPDGLANTYHFLRVGTTLLEEEGKFIRKTKTKKRVLLWFVLL